MSLPKMIMSYQIAENIIKLFNNNAEDWQISLRLDNAVKTIFITNCDKSICVFCKNSIDSGSKEINIFLNDGQMIEADLSDSERDEVYDAILKLTERDEHQLVN